MLGQVLRKSIFFIAVLIVGLFAGFTQVFAFSILPGALSLPFGSFIELFQYEKEIFDTHVLILYLVMLFATGSWLFLWRHRYRMVDFYFVLGAFLCVIQEIVLSYEGHYKVKSLLRTYALTNFPGPDWHSLREELAYFMYFHFITNFVGFILLLAALYRATSTKEPTRKTTLALSAKS
ncbi:MAG: hypothetical protein J7501_00445 [Bdellovibrio sp.]|nr:hypothetical protein [Bdellovibrio sp.]